MLSPIILLGKNQRDAFPSLACTLLVETPRLHMIDFHLEKFYQHASNINPLPHLLFLWTCTVFFTMVVQTYNWAKIQETVGFSTSYLNTCILHTSTIQNIKKNSFFIHTPPTFNLARIYYSIYYSLQSSFKNKKCIAKFLHFFAKFLHFFQSCSSIKILLL